MLVNAVLVDVWSIYRHIS